MYRILERSASIAAPVLFPEICLVTQKAVPIPRLFIWSFIFGALQKRANSYILFVKYQTIKYHTLSISAYEQRERQYPRKQLLPATGQTICRLYGIRQKYGLTTKELFILDIIYFAQSGCTQAGICERLSATKQTVSAAIKNSGSWGTFLLKNPKLTGESGWYASPQPERNTWNASSPLPRRRKTTPWRN